MKEERKGEHLGDFQWVLPHTNQTSIPLNREKGNDGPKGERLPKVGDLVCCLLSSAIADGRLRLTETNWGGNG